MFVLQLHLLVLLDEDLLGFAASRLRRRVEVRQLPFAHWHALVEVGVVLLLAPLRLLLPLVYPAGLHSLPIHVLDDGANAPLRSFDCNSQKAVDAFLGFTFQQGLLEVEFCEGGHLPVPRHKTVLNRRQINERRCRRKKSS